MGLVTFIFDLLTFELVG